MADMEVDTPPKSSNSSNQTAARPRIEIKKWNAVALWTWDIETDMCAICRNNNMEPCIDCQASGQDAKDTEACTLAWGTCNHAFHFHCISRWLKDHQKCPLDNKEWEYQKHGR